MPIIMMGITKLLMLSLTFGITFTYIHHFLCINCKSFDRSIMYDILLDISGKKCMAIKLIQKRVCRLNAMSCKSFG